MARLRIGVEQLGAEGLRVEIDAADGSTDVIELAPGGGIRGRYEQTDDAIGLRSIRAESLVVSEVAWSWSSGRVRGSLRLRDVAIESTIAIGPNREGRPGFVGSIRSRGADGRVELRLGASTWTAGGVELRDFELTASESGQLTLRVGQASIESLRVALDEDERTTIEASDLALLEGIAMEGGHLRVPALTAARLHLRSAAAGAPAAPAWEPLDPSGPSSTSPPRLAPDLPRPPRQPGELPLDGLRGRIEAKIETDITAPIVGRRQATHTVDLRIDDGVIDFHALEKGLSMLEGLVLDFEVKDDALILEKDVPLIPFDNQTLLRWPLDPEGLALAEEGLVRLATLLRPRGPDEGESSEDDSADASSAAPSEAASSRSDDESESDDGDEEDDDGNPVDLHRLDVQDIDVEVAVGELADLRLAGGVLRGHRPDAPTVEWLRLQGHLAHAPDQAPPGALVASAQGLHVALEHLVLGSRRLDVGSLDLEALEGAGLSLRGVRPGSIDARLRGLSLTALTLAPSR